MPDLHSENSGKAIKMYRGRGCEIVDRQNSRISKYIQVNLRGENTRFLLILRLLQRFGLLFFAAFPSKAFKPTQICSMSKLPSKLQENVNKVIHIAVVVRMDAKLFDPFTYLDNVSPTPHKSFLTDNYNARVNSQVWRRKSRR